jgi:hypothetical protein
VGTLLAHPRQSPERPQYADTVASRSHGDTSAMVELSSELGRVGRIADRFSQSGLAYAAYRKGNPSGAQHLAMNAFNRNDLCGYRHWLNKATRSRDREAGPELRRFELRLPHSNAALIRRKRPQRQSNLL